MRLEPLPFLDFQEFWKASQMLLGASEVFFVFWFAT
jgi:hypothetical protein